MKIKNLAPNQLVIEDGEKEIFNSYGSNIAQKSGDQIILDCLLWDYSRTTAKYLSKFLGVNKKEIEKNIKEGIYQLDLLNV